MTTAVPFILWIIWSSATAPLDTRPAVQFDTINECLNFVVEMQTTNQRYKTDMEKLKNLGVTTTLICLPAGVRP